MRTCLTAIGNANNDIRVAKSNRMRQNVKQNEQFNSVFRVSLEMLYKVCLACNCFVTSDHEMRHFINWMCSERNEISKTRKYEWMALQGGKWGLEIATMHIIRCIMHSEREGAVDRPSNLRLLKITTSIVLLFHSINHSFRLICALSINKFRFPVCSFYYYFRIHKRRQHQSLRSTTFGIMFSRLCFQ